MSHAKLAVLVLWIAAASGFLISPSPLATAARALFVLLLLVHAAECLVFLQRLRAAPGPLARQLLLTLVFGVAHLRELAGPKGGSDPEP